MRTRTLLRFDPPWNGLFRVNVTFETKSHPAIVVVYPWDEFLAPLEEWESDFQRAMAESALQYASASMERCNVMEDSTRRAIE